MVDDSTLRQPGTDKIVFSVPVWRKRRFLKMAEAMGTFTLDSRDRSFWWRKSIMAWGPDVHVLSLQDWVWGDPSVYLYLGVAT